MKKLIIFGNGEFASIAKYYFNTKDLAFFVVDDEKIKENKFEKIPLITKSELLKLNRNDYKLFVALSYKKMNSVREEKYKELKKEGFAFSSFVHKKTYISKTAKIGENCLILENQTIQKNVQIGNNVFIWSSNHIGHNSVVMENTYISSHVVISGGCKVGRNCFFGVNSSVKDFTNIGNKVLIGMGSVINKNILDNSVIIANESTIFEPDSKIAQKLLNRI
jgi:sugar O-acyltransferase (sialic acid O-acetyltransferase NeuD family)